MHSILQTILKKTAHDLEVRKRIISIEKLKKLRFDGKVYEFKNSILSSKKKAALIAEIKLASPSSGKLGYSEDVLKRAKAYEKSGADAISFVVEKHFFHGDISFVAKIKKAVSLPVLIKDFIIDEYQIYEAKKNGADAILLLAKILNKKKLYDFVKLSYNLGIEPVVEIDNTEDIKKTVFARPEVIAVNARDLDTFIIDVIKACEIIKEIPDHYIRLGFSGIMSSEDVKNYKNAKVHGILVGTSLMKAKNVQDFIQNLNL